MKRRKGKRELKMCHFIQILVFVFYSNSANGFLWPPNHSTSALSDPGNTVQVSVILANETLIKNLQPRMETAGTAVLRGFQKAAEKNLLPENVAFNVTFRDSRCNIIYSPKAFTDAVIDGVDVLFGPSCDYSLGKNYFKFLDK